MLVGRRINAKLEEQTGLLERTRDERARLAVAEERTRVAREMHDVVAHAVTGMVVQAGGARMVAASDGPLAAAALEDVQEMGHEALQELRSLVDSLDPHPMPLGTEPPPAPPDIGSLIETVSRGGQRVVLLEEGKADVDQGIQISLYRIIQEALTNVRKHAPEANATVSVRHLPQAVEIEVVNDASPMVERATAVPGAGHGLKGIRERASIFGGTAEAGPTAEGGFRVRVRLPLELVPA
jgi:signal transduction histidine kinase